MTEVFFTCDPAAAVIVDGVIECSSWQIREVMFPLYELTPQEYGPLLAAIAGFFALCFAGKLLLRFLTQPTGGGSDS